MVVAPSAVSASNRSRTRWDKRTLFVAIAVLAREKGRYVVTSSILHWTAVLRTVGEPEKTIDTDRTSLSSTYA